MVKNRAYWTVGLFFIAAFAAIVVFFASKPLDQEQSQLSPDKISSSDIATELKSHLDQRQLPFELPFKVDSQSISSKITYTLEPALQTYITNHIQNWGPDYAAFVAIDASTGRVLALTSYQRNMRQPLGHLALRASYPAASVFKVITAAAAIEHKQFSADSLIPFTGSYHTLYRRNVLKEFNSRWVRQMKFKDAFAKSVNSVFGKIGVFHVGNPTLKKFAERFMFNSQVQTDFPVDMGAGVFEDKDPWALAELASGYNRNTTLNPVQGAMIAASVVNGGVMMMPYLVETIVSDSGEVLYRSTPTVASVAMSEKTATRMQELMRETVISGTSSRAFRGLRRNRLFADIEVGGKTGSLTGVSPAGKYDWYVGYARQDDHAIALAALTINTEKWRVKSSQLASDFVLRYFQKFAPTAGRSAKSQRSTASQESRQKN